MKIILKILKYLANGILILITVLTLFIIGRHNWSRDGKIARQERLFLEAGSVNPFVKDTVLVDDWEYRLLPLAMDRNQRRRIEALAAEVKDWKNDDGWRSDNLPWRDIALSLLRYPGKVTFDCDSCDKCGHRCVKLYFRSCELSWMHMCGCAGPMTICPNCRTQPSFQVTSLN